MTRASFRPIATIGLVATLLIYVGCTEKPDSARTPTASPGDEARPEPAKQPAAEVATKGEKKPKFMVDWAAKPPAGILLISGEQNGYPDPCGCTDGQLGGLGRRYDLLEKIHAWGCPVAKIDLGNLLYRPGSGRGGVVQERIKFDIIFDALGQMKYDAVALGAEDLKLGIMTMVGNLLNAQPPKYPVILAANVKPQAGLDSVVSPIKLTSAGPITIGITAVLDPAEYHDLPDPDSSAFEIKTADEVIPGVLEELKKKAQVRVLMVQGPHDEAKRLAEKFPDFDIVVGTSVYEDPDAQPETLNGGKTLLVNNIGKKGKYVGVVGFFPGETPMVQFRRQPLDQVHFQQAEPMRIWIDQEYQERLKRERVVEDFPRIVNTSAPAGAEYIGAEACQSCHPKTYKKWASTKHARAYEALENPKRLRIHDAECISCHTTGFGRTSGWVSAEQTSFLKGNQCENCHGPASLHASEPTNVAFREKMHLSKEMVKAENFCVKCHDSDNDHNFEFENRYAQIFHKGLDDYDDPKTKVGIPPRAKAGSAAK